MIKREAEKKHVVIVGTSFIGKGRKFDSWPAMLQFTLMYCCQMDDEDSFSKGWKWQLRW